ncbi:MAG: hypothetical protein DRG87_02855 [Deltaproteobacteria bacterium]|nr:MAG: hypothetical protein DRG87_02855 [Deltaproteobacteria bacterium]
MRTAQVAKSVDVGKEEDQDARAKALWEMAAVNRNAPGTKMLAQEYGLSKSELKGLLEQYAETRRHEGDLKPLEPCFDIRTGAYLSFEQWVVAFLKKYDKVSVA